MIRRRMKLGAMMALALWAAVTAAPRALAQGSDRLAQLKISVWPEHDQPTVLIMFHGTLADPSNLPRQVSVLVPSSGSLQVTTYENTDGSFAPEQASQSSDLGDGYKRITFTLRTPTLHVEYYDDLLHGAPDKSMDYVFKAPMPVDRATLEVEQPLKATSFSMIPDAQSTRADSDGFKYSSLDLGGIQSGQTISEQVKYTKTDPDPSVSRASDAPAPAPVVSQASSTWNNVFLLVVLIVVGLASVLAFFVVRERNRVVAPVRVGNDLRPRREAEGTAFCTQCGRGLAAEDVFCPRCGTKRRMD